MSTPEATKAWIWQQRSSPVSCWCIQHTRSSSSHCTVRSVALNVSAELAVILLLCSSLVVNSNLRCIVLCKSVAHIVGSHTILRVLFRLIIIVRSKSNLSVRNSQVQTSVWHITMHRIIVLHCLSSLSKKLHIPMSLCAIVFSSVWHNKLSDSYCTRSSYRKSRLRRIEQNRFWTHESIVCLCENLAQADFPTLVDRRNCPHST